MRVYCAVHEAPGESETVYQDALLVLSEHAEAEKPDKPNAYYVSINACLVADPVDYLAHEEGTNHFTEAKYT